MSKLNRSMRLLRPPQALGLLLTVTILCAGAGTQDATTRAGTADGPRLEEQVARLLERIQNGSRDERAEAIRVLADHLRYLPAWQKPSGPILEVIREHALSSEDAETRRHGYKALASLGDASAAPLALTGLDDADQWVRRNALEALRTFGPDRRTNTERIRALVVDPQCSGAAIDALVAIRGEEAIWPLIDAWRLGRLPDPEAAMRHLVKFPDPRAAKLVEAVLKADDHADTSLAPLLAAMYFESLDHWPLSANVLHDAFERFPRRNPAKGGTDNANRQGDDVRKVAATYLGRIRDHRALELLLRAAASDPSFEVRTAAVTALGRLGDERAVAIIDSQLDVDDRGRSSEGHVDGSLHAAAVGALGALAESGTPGALRALYDRLDDVGAFSYTLWRYWAQVDADLTRQAVELYMERPLAGSVAARWFDSIARANAESFEVAAERHKQLADAFRAWLKLQPPKPEPEDAEWVERGLKFYQLDGMIVALRTMSLTYPQWPRRHGSGHTEVYLFHTDHWSILGTTGRWVE